MSGHLADMPLAGTAQASWEISASDCHNRLSALALSEIGEDPCGLMSQAILLASFHIRTMALAIRDDGDDPCGYRLPPNKLSNAGKMR